jgi:hypothetical protein
LIPKVEVPITFKFKGPEVSDRVAEMFNTGKPVEFSAGEVEITGTPIFKGFGKQGSSIQCSRSMPCSCSLIALDSDNREVNRLGGITGKLEGGRKVQSFAGRLGNSPFSVKIELSAERRKRPITININLRLWNKQLLSKLTYFDRLHQFFVATPKSSLIAIEFDVDGNDYRIGTIPTAQPGKLVGFSAYLEAIHKARLVTNRFAFDPRWNHKNFDAEAIDNVQQLYAIFFEGGWKRRIPRLKESFDCEFKNFDLKKIGDGTTPAQMLFTSNEQWELFGRTIDMGRIERRYVNVFVSAAMNETSDGTQVKIELEGTEAAGVSIQLAGEDNGSEDGTMTSIGESPRFRIGS